MAKRTEKNDANIQRIQVMKMPSSTAGVAQLLSEMGRMMKVLGRQMGDLESEGPTAFADALEMEIRANFEIGKFADGIEKSKQLDDFLKSQPPSLKRQLQRKGSPARQLIRSEAAKAGDTDIDILCSRTSIPLYSKDSPEAIAKTIHALYSGVGSHKKLSAYLKFAALAALGHVHPQGKQLFVDTPPTLGNGAGLFNSQGFGIHLALDAASPDLMMGTFMHEVHRAFLQTHYNNDCKPCNARDEKATYGKLVEPTLDFLKSKGLSKPGDRIIDRNEYTPNQKGIINRLATFYLYYQEDQRLATAAVLVPNMLGWLGRDDKSWDETVTNLKNMVPHLYQAWMLDMGLMGMDIRTYVARKGKALATAVPDKGDKKSLVDPSATAGAVEASSVPTTTLVGDSAVQATTENSPTSSWTGRSGAQAHTTTAGAVVNRRASVCSNYAI